MTDISAILIDLRKNLTEAERLARTPKKYAHRIGASLAEIRMLASEGLSVVDQELERGGK